MSRPSKNTDRKLIEAAKQLLPKTGISGLKLRRVAEKAGVNLGMFHYHFKTKDEFVKKILKESYDDFFSNFQIKSSGGGTSVERLKNALFELGKFARDNRSVIVAVIRDILNGHKETVEFAKDNFTRHISVILNLISECRRDGYIIKIPVQQAAVFIVANIVFPNAIMAVLDNYKANKFLGISFESMKGRILSDKAIGRRIDFSLKALSVKTEKL